MSLVENPIFNNSSFVSLGISAYYRYHDDIYIICQSRDSMHALWDSLRVASPHFTHEVREVGSHSRDVSFLDVCVQFRGSQVSAVPSLTKPITPLCASSFILQSMLAGPVVWSEGCAA